VAAVFGGDIFSGNYSPFWGLLLKALSCYAKEHKHRLRIYMDVTGSREGLATHEQLVADLTSEILDGLMLLAPRYEYDHAAQLQAYGVPLVVLGGGSGHWRCELDNQAFINIAAEKILQKNGDCSP